MPPERDPLLMTDKREVTVQARVSDAYLAAIDARCGQLDVRRSDFVVAALDILYRLTEDPELGRDFFCKEKVARLAPKLRKIFVILE